MRRPPARFAGLLSAVAGAVVIGLLMGLLPSRRSATRHSPCWPDPADRHMAVFFVLVGTGQNMYVTMIAFGVLPALAQTVYLAVKDFPEELQYKSYTLGASHAEVIFSIMFRQVLPRLIERAPRDWPALVCLIAAEMVVGDVGWLSHPAAIKLLNMSVVCPRAAGGVASRWIFCCGDCRPNCVRGKCKEENGRP
jgi:ABC-type nitrate/sulfonate/bicarbonate transport system permease component